MYSSIRKNILRKTTSCTLKIRAFKTRQQLYSDISTLFQSYCQTRMKYLQAYYYNIYRYTGKQEEMTRTQCNILFTMMVLNKDR